MKTIYESKGDLEIKCLDGTVNAHSPIIKARCPTLFSYGNNIIQQKQAIVATIVQYLYQDQVSIKDYSVISELLEFAKTLNLPILVTFLEIVSKYATEQYIDLYVQEMNKALESTMKDDILSLLEDTQFKDMEFTFPNNEKVFAHSIIIDKYELFSGKKVAIDYATPEIFNSFLTMLYTGGDEVSVIVDVRLMQLMDKLHFKYFDNIVVPPITYENVEPVIDICSRFEFLLPKIMEFILLELDRSFEYDEQAKARFEQLIHKLNHIDNQALRMQLLSNSNLLNFQMLKKNDLVSINQWVNRIVFCTSNYDGWPPENMIGESNVYPAYGDDRKVSIAIICVLLSIRRGLLPEAKEQSKNLNLDLQCH
jgi:hypothetical protein